jgi:hypothetical protein
MARPVLSGSFFDIQHVNIWDATHWTDECRFWKEENWHALIRDMHGIGIRTVICIQSALWGRPLFPGYDSTVGIPVKMGCRDPLAACADEADRLGMEMYFGIGLRGRVSEVRDYSNLAPPWPEDWFRWNTALAEALVDKFGRRKCFRGLYISYEIDFEDYHVELYEKLVRGWLRPAIGGVTLLASPGSLGTHPNLAALPRQLERMNIDILACQDYGGRSTDVAAALELVRGNLRGLELARPHLEKTGVKLWTNCELFVLEAQPDGRSRCVPGPFERIREQLALQSPLVEKVICYQYQGIMNRRSKLVNIGSAATQELYDAYVGYLEQLPP